MAAMATAEQAEHAASRARNGLRRAPKPRAERAQDAKVYIGCLPQFLGYNLRRAHLCVWRKYVALIGENNIRPGLFSALVLVGSNPGIAQIELGRHLGVDKASMVALLDRLEKAGLLDRQRSTRDRRRQGIFLTSRGSAELESLVTQVRALERQLASRFTRVEFEQLLGFLKRLYT